MRLALLGPIWLLCVGCFADKRPTDEIVLLTPGEARAVAVAEAFVRANGFADQAPHEKEVKWDIMELVALRDIGIPPETVLKWRRNTINPNAYGLSNRGYNNVAGWTVFFLPAVATEGMPHEVKRPTGIAVTMTSTYSDVFMPHMDVFLDCAERILVTTKSAGRYARRRTARCS